MTQMEESNNDNFLGESKSGNESSSAGRVGTYVMKFGGSSLAGSSEILRCVSIIKDHLVNTKKSLIVVCSAMGDTTDRLLRMVELAKVSEYDVVKEALLELRESHRMVILKILRGSKFESEALDFLDSKFEELDRILKGITLLRDLSQRSLDYVLSIGEQLSTFIMSRVLASNGIETRYLTGGQAGIVTDESFGSAQPDFKLTEENLRKNLIPLLDAGIVPVVTGFIAETLRGHDIITLGRGGSDLTASLIGAAIDAEEVFIWTDVDGILTADPRLVKEARILQQITYLEAMEMSAFGAKQMQPRALEPVARKEIPVRIKNTFRPEAEGTLIVSPNKILNSGDSGVKSIGSLSNVAIVSIGGTSIVGQPGTAIKIFEILKELGVNVLMISQSVSESNVSIVIRKERLSSVVRTLRQKLLHSEAIGEDDDEEEQQMDQRDSSHQEKAEKSSKGRAYMNSIFAKVDYEDDVAVVAVLGRGMIGTPGIAARVFTTVASLGINIRMIAQGSSEINISFVIKEKERARAVRALHDEFCLGQTHRNLLPENAERNVVTNLV